MSCTSGCETRATERAAAFAAGAARRALTGLSRAAVLLLLAALAFVAAARGPLGAAPGPIGDLPLAELGTEARATLERIRAGGPHRYRQDGRVFFNRERLLPRRARDYYREYTVPTPGRRDRGARRIVAGRGGELYYTDDHYRSFRRIRQ